MGRRKFTILEVRKIFSNRGFELLENKYINNSTKMKFRCSACNNIWQMCLAKVKLGRGCRFCSIKKTADKQRNDFQMVFDYFSSQGCVLLDKVYKNSKSPMQYLCKCGRQSSISWTNFKKGKRCQKCKGDNSRGEKSKRWKIDREMVCLKDKVLKKCCKAIDVCLGYIGRDKENRINELLGYSTIDLIARLESFPNWQKLKNGVWHLDHIFPVSAFVSRGIFDLALINSLDNLQPLSAYDNLSKNCKYDKVEFDKWLIRKGVK